MASLKFRMLAAALTALLVSAPYALAEDGTLRGRITLLSEKSKPLKPENVVVFIDTLPGQGPFSPPEKHPEIRQRGKKFYPEVLPVLAGTTVDFVNDDNLFHNVFSRSKAKPFDLGVYKQGLRKSLTFDSTGLVKVYCNIHFNMVTFILVLNNPYFAVTNTRGEYAISGVPPGTYTVRVWQRFGQEESRTVTIRDGGETSLDVTLAQDKVSIRHKNKYGREYALHSGMSY